MRPTHTPPGILTGILTTTVLVTSGLAAAPHDGQGNVCKKTAQDIRKASINEAFDCFWVGIANCINVSNPGDAFQCFLENGEALQEALGLAAEQYQARLDLCDLIGGGRYDPQIDPNDFVQGVTNPFFPLNPGTTLVYRTETDEGTEMDEATVTHDTKEILGVECIVVHDVVRLEGVLVEDTLDYYAQDVLGNVWYFGELSIGYEDGEIASLDGSWLAGRDGARPGIIMEAAPMPGDAYRQEFLANEAEDAASVTGLDRMVSVPAGDFDGCLETRDFTPIEPDVFEAKFYAPGVGVVLEVDLETGERTELVDIL